MRIASRFRVRPGTSKRVGVTSLRKEPSGLRFICMVSVFMTVKTHPFFT
jgi:hypothetical protein